MRNVKQALLFLLRIYQLCISPYIGRNCRFYPSCSEYARQAIDQHGIQPGALLAIKRLCKCHPWNPGGVDLVPQHTKHPAQCS